MMHRDDRYAVPTGRRREQMVPIVMVSPLLAGRWPPRVA
jgi:hypothetical protein